MYPNYLPYISFIVGSENSVVDQHVVKQSCTICDVARLKVVRKVDNVTRPTNHYPVDSVVSFVNTYQLDSDLFSGKRYSALEQPGPDDFDVMQAHETLPFVKT